MGGGNYKYGGGEGETQNPGTMSQRVTTGGGGSLLSCGARMEIRLRRRRSIGRGPARYLGGCIRSARFGAPQYKDGALCPVHPMCPRVPREKSLRFFIRFVDGVRCYRGV